MLPCTGLSNADLLDALLATIGQVEARGDEASHGPDEPCIADADLEWLADREEARTERAKWGGA